MFFLSDGKLCEGQIWEAAAAASHFKLNNLVGIVDRNRVEVDGTTKEIMYSLKPIDREAIETAARETRHLFTAEEHNIIGGLGSAVSEVLTEAGLPAQLVRMGIPDEYSILGPPTHLYSHYGIDSEGIAKRVKEALKVERGGGDENAAAE